MSEMDDVDQRQQAQIHDLQKKDVEHDAQLSLWTKLSMVAFAIVLALFVGGVILAPILLSQKDDKTDAEKIQAYWCPHEDCPHHRTLKGYAVR